MSPARSKVEGIAELFQDFATQQGTKIYGVPYDANVIGAVDNKTVVPN